VVVLHTVLNSLVAMGKHIFLQEDKKVEA